jgi:hypothetical protein
LSKISVSRAAVYSTIVVAFAFAIIQAPSDFRRSNITDDKETGEFLVANTEEGTAIMTSSINLAWYANRPRVSMNSLREVNAEELERAVAETPATVLAYTKRHSAKSFGQLAFLLDPHDPRVPPSFRLLYHRQGEWPVTVYEIESAGKPEADSQ